jgi:DNA polymerase-3 subunit alpha
MGFPGYFLIVADFIKWAKSHDIPVGPGRGSGAGSVVAWALTITDLDPLKLGLLFERFLNPERVSMPDFDIDFCETRRGEVIRYVQDKYGRDTVAQIITFGKLKARAVLKDTGRVLQMSYGQVDRLAKLVPNHPTDPWTLERALNGVSELMTEYKQDDGVRRLFDMARQLEGLPRHSSTHAAGVVIGDRPLDQLVPLYRDPRSDMPVTQFDMKYVESAGLVKRGLRTAPTRRDGRGVPARIRRDAAHAVGGEAHQFRRHHRAGRALSPGADGQYPTVRRAQERARADRLSTSPARRHPRRNLWHLRLSGTGDAGGADPGWL